MDVLYTGTHGTELQWTSAEVAELTTQVASSSLCVSWLYENQLGVLVLYTDSLVYIQMQAHFDIEQITN